MNKSPKAWFKKNYFTHSQPALPTNHPNEEFITIIQLKKHYQSLIKQELHALASIENAQNNELILWQNQLEKQVKVSLFEVKQPEDPPKAEKTVIEKSSQQFVSCYDALKLIKMQKSFARLKQKLTLSRQIGIKKRAASYLSSHHVSQRWFTIWKQQAKEALTDANITKNKQTALANRLRNIYSAKLIECLRFGSKKKQLTAMITANCKKTFVSRMCNVTSIRFVKIRQQHALRQMKKRRALAKLKKYIQNRLKVAEISLKSKLLKNIFCHRKFNIFFAACKQQRFKQEQTQITHEIINKVDVLALITQSSQISQPIDQNSSQHQIFAQLRDAKSKPTLNVLLLNLILENFVDEYSQQFSANFSEQQRLFLLVELRSLIVSELIVKQKSRFLIKSLGLQLNARRLQANLQLSHLSSALQQLKSVRELNACSKQLAGMVRQQRMRQFIQLMRLGYSINHKKQKLESSRVGLRWRGRKCFSSWKQHRLNSQVWRLNQQMAANWHKMYCCRLYFSRWVEAKYQANQQHEYEVESPLKIQHTNQAQRAQPKSPTLQARNSQLQNTQKVTKVKMQLSKIVSAISKSMIATKFSLDSYSKSIELPDSHRLTQFKMKTASAPHIDYEPRAFELQLHKKQSIEEELDRLIENKLARLTQKIKKSRLVDCLKLMRQECHFNSCVRRVKEAKRQKWINALADNWRCVSVGKRKMGEVLVGRQRRALMKYRANCDQKRKIRNELQFKSQILNQFLMKSAINRVGYAINSISLRVHLQKQLGQLIQSRFITRGRQFLRNTCRPTQLSIKQRTLHSAKLKQHWNQFINNIKRQVQQAGEDNQRRERINESVQVYEQQGNYLADYLDNSEAKEEQQSQLNSPQSINQGQRSNSSQLQSDEQQSLNEEQASEQSEEQSYQHHYYQQDHYRQQHHQQSLESSQQHNQLQHHQQQHSQQQQHHSQEQAQQYHNQQEVNNFSHVQPYSLNTSINTHQPKLQPASTEPATSSQHFKNNSSPTHQHEESASQEQEWLQQQLANNSAKKQQKKLQSTPLISHLIQFSKAEIEQPATIKQHKLSLDDSITQEQPLFMECKRAVLKQGLLQLLQNHRRSEQRAIRKQQQQEIIKYQLHKRHKQLKANAFRALLDEADRKKDKDLLIKSWQAWILLTQQKRTLKQYLQLQHIAEEQSLSYYPTAHSQKQMFEYLKKQ